MPLPPGLQTTWNQLSHHLGHYHQIPEATTRVWRLALSRGNTRWSGICQTRMRATFKECGHTRCSFSFCSDYIKPCNTCQTVPPSHPVEQGAKTGSATILSTNLHQVGEHFIETISEVEPDSWVEGVDPDRTEDPNQLLQNIRFKATIRGWSHRTHQHHVTTLLNLQNEHLGRRMCESQDLILLPENWWSLSMDTLGPNESGWWYRVSDPIRFRECKACRKRIGEDVQTGHKTLDTGV